MKTFLLLLHVALPLIGIADASYLAYEELQGIVPPCGSGFSCGEVLSSPYAHIGPVPLYALGLLFYLTLFILGVATILELDIKGFVPKKLQSFATLPQLFTTLATLGGLFSLYLVFIMAFVIKGWCLYCLISAATSMTLFFVSWKYFSMTQKKPHLLLKTISHTIFNFLYTQLLKPVLFLFDPETIHTAFTKAGYILGQNSLTRSLTNWIFSYNSPTTAVTFNGISFPNKIGLCAGFDYNGEMARILGPVGFGFHTIGTVTAQPYQGNPKPRLGRLPDSKALIVNKGLKSLGAKTIIAKLSGIHFSVPVGISIASTNTHFDSDHEQVFDSSGAPIFGSQISLVPGVVVDVVLGQAHAAVNICNESSLLVHETQFGLRLIEEDIARFGDPFNNPADIAVCPDWVNENKIVSLRA